MNIVVPITEPQTRARTTARPKRTLPLDQIIQGDCIAEMARLPDKSVDMIFADPPYALTDPERLAPRWADISEDDLNCSGLYVIATK